jgi:hypothetical protein
MKTAILGAALLFVLAACGTPARLPSAPLSPSPSPSPSLEPTSAPPPSAPTSAADGTNVKACYDGNCEILVSKSLRIPLHPRFRTARMSVSVSGTQLTVTATPEGGGGSQCSIGGGGECSFSNGGPTITLHAWSLAPGKSILRITS